MKNADYVAVITAKLRDAAYAYSLSFFDSGPLFSGIIHAEEELANRRHNAMLAFNAAWDASQVAGKNLLDESSGVSFRTIFRIRDACAARVAELN